MTADSHLRYHGLDVGDYEVFTRTTDVYLGCVGGSGRCWVAHAQGGRITTGRTRWEAAVAAWPRPINQSEEAP